MASEDGRIERPARRRHTDERIEKAVLQLLREGGPDAVTTVAVGRLAHVSRATLYRRYSNRLELLAAVAKQVTGPTVDEFGDGHGLHSLADLERAIDSVLTVYTSQAGPTLMAHLLTSKDESVHPWRSKIAAPYRQALKDAFLRGVEAGDLRDDLSYDRVVEFILGGMVVSDALVDPLPDNWAHEAAQILWPRIAVSP